MVNGRSISIIIPTLNEEHVLGELIDALQTQSKNLEIIVVDGGSSDGTLALVSEKPNVIVKESAPGRAIQMNLGAKHANGNTFAFVHADTKISKDFVQILSQISENKWGYFKVALSGRKLVYRVIASMMNIRSRMTSVITGDMVLVICEDLFSEVNGFPAIPIMEDVEISKRLRRHYKPEQLNSTVTTSSRRWDTNGVYKTIFLMWRLRLEYFLGVNPSQLVKRYERGQGINDRQSQRPF